MRLHERQVGTTLTPVRTINLPQPTVAPGTTTDNVTAILNDGGAIPITRPVTPVTEFPELPVRQTAVPVPGSNVQVPAGTVVTTETATGAGLIAWAKANPLPATAIAVVAAYLVYKLVKK